MNKEEEEFIHKCVKALEMTCDIVENAYGEIPDPQEAPDRFEAFKIILEKAIEYMMCHEPSL